MKPLKRQIAAALGVSPPMITKYVKLGMPVYSIEAARQWREQHIDPALRKEWRSWAHADAAPPPPPPPPPAPLDPAEAIERVHKLFALARSDIALAEPFLRKAMRDVPHACRPQVDIDPHVMKQLIEPHLAATADVLQPQPLHEDSATVEFMEMFWYACACYEIYPDGNKLVVRPEAAWVFDGLD